ncbi:hypothetical protein P2H44_17175 [Albimonas sp. CAU 1670]|uniref:hypothetical protein n=1 Tax=Albimonas sp. CAU 1670 TaxID=3032599 RepID=UPI0023DA3208|nr:hypothetical protein [Albimonas sp. CAU 1670]MDF2234295.1 hypothetical protein [Albimonas sp. CAU 1670]
MTLMHVTARAEELLVRDARGRPGALDAGLAAVPPHAPVAILVHGYKYRPFDPVRDPHDWLFGLPGRATGGPDWPAALGFSRLDPADGLCIGFGWDAWAAHGPSFARHGRNGFAEVYERAGAAAERLAALVVHLAALRPDLEIDLFAHSLGARLALGALADPRARPALGRVLLLGAAEDASLARAAMTAGEAGGGRGPQVFHIAARHNDPYDALFEAAAPRLAGRRRQALGRAGLGARRADWIDLQLDRPEFADWARARGAPLAGAAPRVCHWSFYERPGAMDLHRAILRERAAWSIEALRAAGAPEGLGPRWSRLAPPLAPGAALRGWSAPWPVLRRAGRGGRMAPPDLAAGA